MKQLGKCLFLDKGIVILAYLKIQTMDKNELLIIYLKQTIAKRTLFYQWLIKLNTINEELKNKYDRFYFNIYYINLSELINPKGGMSFIDEITKHGLHPEISMYFILKDKLQEIIDYLSEDELIWINYKRDCSSHIFVESYNQVELNNKGELNEKVSRKNRPLKPILNSINKLLSEHNKNDQEVDIYVHNKLYQKIHDMFVELEDSKY